MPRRAGGVVTAQGSPVSGRPAGAEAGAEHSPGRASSVAHTAPPQLPVALLQGTHRVRENRAPPPLE